MDSVYFRSSFWNDPYVLSLDKDIKIVYIYLFTNNLIKSSGIYEFYIEDIQRRTGVNKKKIELALKELEKFGKIYVVKGWVFIVNFLKKTFNFPQSVLSKNIKRSITNQFNNGNVPLELIACFLKEYQTLYKTLSQDLGQDLLVRIKDLGLRIKDLEKDNPPTPPKEETFFSLPEFINQETWQDFLDMRKAIKKPATPKAQELLVKKLTRFREQGQDPNLILEQSIINSWAGVFEIKADAKKRTHAGDTPYQPKKENKPIKSLNPKAEKLWEQVKAKIKPQIPEESFVTWLEPTVGYDLEGDKLVVLVRDQLRRNWILAHYAGLIKEALPDQEVEFVVVPKI